MRRLAAATGSACGVRVISLRLSKKSIRILSDGGIPALRASVGQALVARGESSHDNSYADLGAPLRHAARRRTGAALRHKVEALAHKPLISVVMPTYNTPAELLG